MTGYISKKFLVTFCQGPLLLFNANITFNRPEIITLHRKDRDGFGISIRGSAPTIICKISSWRKVSVEALSTALITKTT